MRGRFASEVGGEVVQAATWAVWIEDLDDDSPARQLRLGVDTQGRLLETVVLVFDSGNGLVHPRDEGASADARPAVARHERGKNSGKNETNCSAPNSSEAHRS